MAKDESGKRNGSGGKFLIIVMAILVLGLLAAGGFLFMKSRQLRDQRNTLQAQNNDLTKQLNAYKADPNAAGQAEADKTIAEVGKLFDLPKDEKPLVGKVNDVEKLPKDQPFFAKAVKDDVTLIYSKAKLGILYRPSTKQIINVGSVTIQDQPAAAAPAP